LTCLLCAARPKAPAEQFSQALVPNPFRAEYDEFVYRTGDLVTLQADGNYAYTGRRDNMVKIRGYRVELGEVETTLYRHPAIREAAVLPTQDELLGTRLRAVVTTDGGGNLAREEVLDHCRQWLPSYMVPDIVEFREEMPRTSTGKVDRAGLAQERNELMLAGDGRRNKR
jgi:acyl-coenzyme A synthetase/AMP-(fatty) acid ligase